MASRNLCLLGDASELWRARRFAEEAAEAFGFDDNDSYAFAFAVNEAVSNAIEHGRPCRDGNVRLRIDVERSGLTFRVKDCGDFTASSGPLDPMADRGRGLAFMAAMVDELEVKPVNGGTLVRLTKLRSPEVERAA
jgi:anti-sigma regulatory factor (Ser/Thr protein kinase)